MSISYEYLSIYDVLQLFINILLFTVAYNDIITLLQLFLIRAFTQKIIIIYDSYN